MLITYGTTRWGHMKHIISPIGMSYCEIALRFVKPEWVDGKEVCKICARVMSSGKYWGKGGEDNGKDR